MSEAESKELLEFLFQHQLRSRFQYAHMKARRANFFFRSNSKGFWIPHNLCITCDRVAWDSQWLME